MSRALDNSNPTIFAPTTSTSRTKSPQALLWDDQGDSEENEEIDAEEVFGASPFGTRIDWDSSLTRASIRALVTDLLRSVTDPEHPVSLEQLHVVSLSDIQVSGNRILVSITPTIPHCSMATLIGLSLRVRLMRALPPRFRVDIRIKEGTHQSENAVNKQLNDKERVQAALENQHLLQVVEGCLATAGQRGRVAIEEVGNEMAT
ncbi:hypothetical protein P7C73_g724, partial [Tremellales sp. Uapishka_1]